MLTQISGLQNIHSFSISYLKGNLSIMHITLLRFLLPSAIKKKMMDFTKRFVIDKKRKRYRNEMQITMMFNVVHGVYFQFNMYSFNW